MQHQVPVSAKECMVGSRIGRRSGSCPDDRQVERGGKGGLFLNGLNLFAVSD